MLNPSLQFQTSALQLIQVFEDDFAPRGLMRCEYRVEGKYSMSAELAFSPADCPDVFSTYLTYACVSLLKVDSQGRMRFAAHGLTIVLFTSCRARNRNLDQYAPTLANALPQ